MEEYDVEKMGKWHHDVLVANGVRTSSLSIPYNSVSHVAKTVIAQDIYRIYKEELKNKIVLDIACNAGGHLFELNRFGIQAGFGFDIRQMWIDQAHWLKRNVDFGCSNLEFVQGSFDCLDNFDDAHFHMSLFNGIFYHLADPIAELSRVAKKTSEILIINTAYNPSSGCNQPALVYKSESKHLEHGLSGMEGLSWHPNGEAVLYRILEHLGFPYGKLMFKNPQLGRLAVIASRVHSLI
jgi:SAM-dependent methyltransferase